MEKFTRTISLIGNNAFNKLSKSHVMIVGIGGVGSYVAESLVRSGVGNITIVDGDNIEASNINRQLFAFNSTIGMRKVDAAENRLKDINNELILNKIHKFILPENIDIIDFKNIDFIVDAIDTVSSKLALIKKAKELNIPIISSMGTGNKTDPTKFKIVDIKKTNTCPLAKVMRYELRKLGIENVKVLFSDELPKKVEEKVPATIVYTPAIAGLLISKYVIDELIKDVQE